VLPAFEASPRAGEQQIPLLLLIRSAQRSQPWKPTSTTDWIGLGSARFLGWEAVMQPCTSRRAAALELGSWMQPIWWACATSRAGVRPTRAAGGAVVASDNGPAQARRFYRALKNSQSQHKQGRPGEGT